MFNLKQLRHFSKIILTPSHCSRRWKHFIDKSKIPEIKECDLEEKFVRGSGPGGSAVNTNSNCVVIIHKPSGLVAKSHESRCQDVNRKLAREKLVTKLDNILNGENSIEGQKKRIEKEKGLKNKSKRRKMAELKSKWMQENKNNKNDLG